MPRAALPVVRLQPPIPLSFTHGCKLTKELVSGLYWAMSPLLAVELFRALIHFGDLGTPEASLSWCEHAEREEWKEAAIVGSRESFKFWPLVSPFRCIVSLHLPDGVAGQSLTYCLDRPTSFALHMHSIARVAGTALPRHSFIASHRRVKITAILLSFKSFLADRTIGRAYGTVCRLSSVCLSVCRL